jgi:hypothetical protein
MVQQCPGRQKEPPSTERCNSSISVSCSIIPLTGKPGLPHSKTLRDVVARSSFRPVLECGGSSASAARHSAASARRRPPLWPRACEGRRAKPLERVMTNAQCSMIDDENEDEDEDENENEDEDEAEDEDEDVIGRSICYRPSRFCRQ